MEWRLAGGGGRGQKLSEASFNRDFAAMTAFVAWARVSDLVREDFHPFRKVHQLKEHKGVRPHREVAPEDFLAARGKLPKRWADAVTVLYGTGFRWGSLARMTGDCIDDARKVIRGPRPKGKRAVEVPVSVEVLDAALRCVEAGLPNDKAAQLSRRLTVACRAAEDPRSRPQMTRALTERP